MIKEEEMMEIRSRMEEERMGKVRIEEETMKEAEKKYVGGGIEG